MGVTLVILFGEGLVRLIDAERRPCSLDDGLLRLEGGLLVRHGGLGCRHIGLGLVERNLIIAVVDPREDLAGLHGLVVAHENSRDISRHLWGDRGAVGLDVGIVRRNLEAAHGPVVPAEMGGSRERDKAGPCQKQLAQPALFRSLLCRHGVGGKVQTIHNL